VKTLIVWLACLATLTGCYPDAPAPNPDTGPPVVRTVVFEVETWDIVAGRTPADVRVAIDVTVSFRAEGMTPEQAKFFDDPPWTREYRTPFSYRVSSSSATKILFRMDITLTSTATKHALSCGVADTTGTLLQIIHPVHVPKGGGPVSVTCQWLL